MKTSEVFIFLFLSEYLFWGLERGAQRFQNILLLLQRTPVRSSPSTSCRGSDTVLFWSPQILFHTVVHRHRLRQNIHKHVLKITLNLFTYLSCLSGERLRHIGCGACVEVRGQLAGVSSPKAIWVPGIELQASPPWRQVQ